MVKTKKGDYKFPGGGARQDESHAETLKREVLEETGFYIVKVCDLLGLVVEKRPDKFDNTKIFEMKSYYYLCETGERQAEQALDAYERELDFRPVWVDINTAYLKNAGLIAAKTDDANPWLARETLILQELICRGLGHR